MNTLQSHVAILALPLGSHAGPLYNLASKLAATQPATNFSFFTTAATKASLSALISTSTPNLTVFTIHDGLPENPVPALNLEERIVCFLKATPDNFLKGLESAGLPRIVLVVSDSFLCCGREIAVKMGVPWIAFWVPSPASLATYFHTQTIRDSLGFRNDDDSAAILRRADEYLDFIPALSYLKISDLEEGIAFGGTTFQRNFVKEVGDLMPKASAVIFNNFEDLDPAIHHLRSHFRKCITVGPLTVAAPPVAPDLAHVLHWLDGREPASVVYVAFGTAVFLTPSDLTELAEGLASTGKPFVWALKEQQHQMLPSGYVERTGDYGLLVKWAPQVQVLGHVAIGAFVTHCGWSSMGESIAAGVPMLCCPVAWDQRVNGRLISHVCKVGIMPEGFGFKREEVKKGVELLLGAGEGKVIRGNVIALKARANSAIQPGGSSSENIKMLAQMINSLSANKVTDT